MALFLRRDVWACMQRHTHISVVCLPLEPLLTCVCLPVIATSPPPSPLSCHLSPLSTHLLVLILSVAHPPFTEETIEEPWQFYL